MTAYPPTVYGGAGVHVEYLTRELARLDDDAHQVTVYCFGDQDEQHFSWRAVAAQTLVFYKRLLRTQATAKKNASTFLLSF